MIVHKEGKRILTIVFLSLVTLNVIIYFLSAHEYIQTAFILASVLFYTFVIRFFRKPKRIVTNPKDDTILSPCDGTVVVIEETEETEFLNQKCIQVSVFMSVWNVHINWFPLNGIVKYFKYHPGKFLLARNPKSSTLNERTTVVVENNKGTNILFRQIAGIAARRVVCYAKEGIKVKQGQEVGFIKFGSRVDLFLPLDAKIKVELNQKVRGNISEIAEL